MNHFQRHGPEFGFATPMKYQQAAIALFAGALSATLLECTRPSGDFVRLDKILDHFGVLSHDSFVRTLYRPRPQHGETKQGYFERQCKQN